MYAIVIGIRIAFILRILVSKPAKLFLMKNTLLGLLSLALVTLARADFTSYTLDSQSNPLTYDPVVSYTWDTLSINFTGNSGGNTNYTTNFGTGAIVTLSFTSTTSIIGHSVQLAWLYPDASSVYTYWPSVVVPGTVFAGSGAGDFVITGNTVTINNNTSGWSAAAFNGFVITDLTRREQGPDNHNVPDTASTLALLGASFIGLAAFRRRFAA